MFGDPDNPDDPWDLGDEGPPPWWVDGKPPPEPPRITAMFRQRLDDLEGAINSWETPNREALDLIAMLRFELDDHDDRYAAGEGMPNFGE